MNSRQMPLIKAIVPSEFVFAATIIIIGFALGLRLWSVTALDFWVDEIFTLNATAQNWAEMFRTLINDRVHPPLFYVLFKLWRFGGESVFWLRLFSVCFAVLAILPFYFLCRELGLNKRETVLALLLATVNYYLIYYAQELRMYSQLWFFAVCSLWLFARFDRSESAKRLEFGLLFAVNLLLVYTHYFGWLIIGFEGLYLLIENRRRFLSFALGALGLAACFAPWALVIGQAIAEKRGIENLGWLQAPGFGDLTGFYATLNGTFNVAGITIVHLLIFGTLICLASLRVFASADSAALKTWKFLLFFAFAPVLLIFIVSRFVPVWDYRYLIIAAAPYFILLAKSALHFDSQITRRIIAGIVLTWAFAACFYNLNKPNKRIAWSSLVADASREDAASGANVRTKIYTFEAWETLPIKFYLNQKSETRLEVVKINSVNEITDQRFWMVVRDTAWRLETTPQDFWSGKNCRLGYEQEFAEQGQKVLLLEVEACP